VLGFVDVVDVHPEEGIWEPTRDSGIGEVGVDDEYG
jgi:hypothetical protein